VRAADSITPNATRLHGTGCRYESRATHGSAREQIYQASFSLIVVDVRENALTVASMRRLAVRVVPKVELFRFASLNLTAAGTMP
jgi:hypothetical protein